MAGLETLFSLSGRTVLVTGSGSVPRAIAVLFQAAGGRVTHIADPDVSEAGVAALFADHPALDVLVNGAVVTGAWPIEQLTLDEWDRVQDINLRGAFLLMRAAVATMRNHGRGGRLIAISTIGSVHPVLHGNYAYGASRAGTNALVRQFALDFAADGIAANAILVGAVPSDPFPADCPMPPTGPGMNPERFPMGHGTADDIAPLALLLASDAGRYINGQAIAVDGGFLVA